MKNLSADHEAEGAKMKTFRVSDEERQIIIAYRKANPWMKKNITDLLEVKRYEEIKNASGQVIQFKAFL